MQQQARRGFVPSDEKEFGESSLPVLHRAAEEVYYLINRGYPVTNVTKFVGNHYMLSERQRLALARSISPKEQLISRKEREVKSIAGRTIYIDGFNVIIGLEIAFSKSVLFRCMDGTIRDLAGLRGTYRLIPETDMAAEALSESLEELQVEKAVIYLDKPVSNSGRLKQKLLSYAEGTNYEMEVVIEDAVDHELKQKPLVATGDAIILDECDQWFNLAEYVISHRIGKYPYITIYEEDID